MKVYEVLGTGLYFEEEEEAWQEALGRVDPDDIVAAVFDNLSTAELLKLLPPLLIENAKEQLAAEKIEVWEDSDFYSPEEVNADLLDEYYRSVL